MFNEMIATVEALWGPHIDWKQLVLMAATPVFLIAFFGEYLIRQRRGAGHPMWRQFELREILTNLGLGGSYQLLEFAIHFFVTGAIVLWIYQFRLFDIELTAYTALPLFLLMEFCYYWFHRGSHRIRWFWSAHVVHHSSETMNMTTAMRQSLLYSITGWWLFFMPMVLLGVHPAAVFFLYALNLCYQFFIHTEAVDRLPKWCEWLMNTPSHHRVHHGRNPEYIDRNYGGVVIIFDRLFGTFVAEDRLNNPVDYGIVDQIRSHNIVTLNTHEFLAMWRSVAAAPGFTAGLKVLLGPPKNRAEAQETRRGFTETAGQ
ncbi:sterol desaturase family protein [Spongiibacter sp. KMU-166]|uniref:Sterol desaturase family protein n=1 Tax=Spongiibacter thalassae TaxID=2721624 RepID=A0ABX1GF67_9GAMM|nr:sterol desaturase family protein [Spongiibacter thalassae]NKI17796.1 sterol desaturase family protein [Spongiibacter thalassae]